MEALGLTSYTVENMHLGKTWLVEVDLPQEGFKFMYLSIGDVSPEPVLYFRSAVPINCYPTRGVLKLYQWLPQFFLIQANDADIIMGT